jgi:hypothetical protein
MTKDRKAETVREILEEWLASVERQTGSKASKKVARFIRQHHTNYLSNIWSSYHQILYIFAGDLNSFQ